MNENYLTNMPQELETWGLCKVLMVRKEIIHIKHIFKHLFVKRDIVLDVFDKLYNKVFKSTNPFLHYMEVMTNRIRHIHKISREYKYPINEITKSQNESLFPTLELHKGFKNIIVLDFDGVVTKPNFKPLYELCLNRCKTVICTANPTVNNEWFEKRGYKLPDKIYANKGKIAKINYLIQLLNKNDFVFYVDNEEEYLSYAWLYGINTYHFRDNKIKFFTLIK